jgi:hypothetical protein
VTAHLETRRAGIPFDIVPFKRVEYVDHSAVAAAKSNADEVAAPHRA